MRKRLALMVVLAVAGIFAYMRGWPNSEEGFSHRKPGIGARDVRSSSLSARAPDRFNRSAEAGASAREARIIDPTRVTQSERAIMSMYDDLTKVFEKTGVGCREMGIAVETATSAHAQDLMRLSRERSELSPEAWSEAQERLQRLDAERMEHVRAAIEQAVARCKTNDRLLAALRDLARMAAGG